MESNKSINEYRQDEISLKEVILKFKTLLSYLKKRGLVIVFFSILGLGFGIIFSIFSKTKYVGQLIFVLQNVNTGSALNAYIGIASQYGIDLSGGGGSGVFEGDNIMEFLKSRLMIEKALLSPIIVDGRKMSFAEYYIDFNSMRDSWKGKPELLNIHYPLDIERSKYSIAQDSLLGSMYRSLLKKNLVIEKKDKKLGFISVSCSTTDEKFSKFFIEQLVREATQFYVDTKIGKTKSNVDKLQAQADSMELQLNRKTYSVAKYQDINQNPARQISNVPSIIESRDKFVLETMYGEIVKNLELSKIALAQETPIIQIIDKPILPLEKKRIGLLTGALIGAMLGAFLIIFYLLLRRSFKVILS